MKDTIKLVMQSLANTLNMEADNIKPTDKLKEELGLDSMSSLIFLMNLEDTINRFHIDPDTLDSEYLETVMSITQYVDAQLACASKAA